MKNDTTTNVKAMDNKGNQVMLQEEKNGVEIDFSTIKSPKSKSNSKSATSPGVLSVIKSKCGNRISVSPNVYQRLGTPENLQIGFCETEILLGVNLPEEYERNVVKQEGKNNIKGLIYNTGLINEMVEQFDLNFDDRTSITFQGVRYENYKEKEVAYIKMLD